MTEVPTLHIRNVPGGVYQALRERATRGHRSLNAEVIDLLEKSLAMELETERLRAQLEEFRREWLAPDDAPTPEEMIRAGREERDRRIAGDL
jgi:plasmid stability protein